jgi:hypothetical protein
VVLAKSQNCSARQSFIQRRVLFLFCFSKITPTPKGIGVCQKGLFKKDLTTLYHFLLDRAKNGTLQKEQNKTTLN